MLKMTAGPLPAGPLIPCDPGKRKSALARFENARLVRVAWGLPGDLLQDVIGDLRGATVLIEKPFSYPPSKSKPRTFKRPNDLIDLMSAGADWAGQATAGGASHEFVYPASWKGQAKKPVSHLGIWRALTAEEKEVCSVFFGLSVSAIGIKIREACERLARTGQETGYSWAAHNLLDAIGIGLWRLRRK